MSLLLTTVGGVAGSLVLAAAFAIIYAIRKHGKSVHADAGPARTDHFGERARVPESELFSPHDDEVVARAAVFAE